MKRIEIDFKMELPLEALIINQLFKDNGFELFVVGGSVRDALDDVTPKDFDLATNAMPDEVVKILSIDGITMKKTGIAFGIVNVFINHLEFEIATFRIDQFKDNVSSGRRPDSVEFTTIEGDVSRRDLSINALFYDIENEKIIDLVGGINDLRLKIIKTVGNPLERFVEDRLRIMRVIRFTARFTGMIDEETHQALIKDSSLEGISKERINDEFIKGLNSSVDFETFLSLMKEYNLFQWIFEDLEIDFSTISDLSINRMTDISGVIALLLRLNKISEVERVLFNSKFKTETIKEVSFLLGLKDIEVGKVFQMKKKENTLKISKTLIHKFSEMSSLDLHLIHSFTSFELSVDGNKLMEETGLKQGKQLGLLISELEETNFIKTLE